MARMDELSPDSLDLEGETAWCHESAFSIIEQMTHSNNSSYQLDDLFSVLESALFFISRQQESKEANEAARFLSVYLSTCVGHHLIFPKQLPRMGANVDPEALVHVIMALISLTATVQHWWISVLDEGRDPTSVLEGYLLQLLLACLQSLALLLDYQCPLYNWKAMVQEFQQGYPEMLQSLWPKWQALAEQVPCIKQDKTECVFNYVQDVSPELGVEMLHQLYDSCSGAELCKQSLVHIGKQHLLVVESTLRLVSKVRYLEFLCSQQEEATPVEFWSQDLVNLKHSLVETLQTDPEQLNPDRERTYSTLSSLMVYLFEVWKNLMNEHEIGSPSTSAGALIRADAEVREVQRVFVLEMLRSSNFNKLLSAARECHLLMDRSKDISEVDSGRSLQENVAWMDSNDVLRKMLRANLHQRQYAELVLKILQVLNESGLLRSEHLDILWAATEAEGTFDVVKSNVFTMIEELAGNLSQNHFEQLFRKFDGLVQARSLGDSLRLLDLLKKLAESDTSHSPNSNHVPGQMAEKLLDIVWQLTMPADAPPELLEADAMAAVLKQYQEQPGPQKYLETYLFRCIEQLRAKQGVFTALHVLVSLLKLYDDLTGKMRVHFSGCDMSANQQLLLQLEERFDLQQLLVSNLCDFVAAARRWLAEPVEAGGGGGARHRLNSGPEVVGFMRLPGQGCYTYSAVVDEYLKAITHIAHGSFNYYPTHLAEQLWDTLVLQPAHPSDVRQGLNFMQQGVAWDGFFEVDTTRALLVDRITALPASSLGPEAWEVYQRYFISVNDKAHHLTDLDSEETGLKNITVNHWDQLEGVSFSWDVAMDSSNPQVVQQAMQLLLRMYITGFLQLDARGPSATQTFIRECSQHLMQSAAVLAGRHGLSPSSNVAAPPAVGVEEGQDLSWLHQAAEEASRAALAAGPVRTAQAISSGVSADELNRASRRVQRCLQLMAMAIEAGQLPILPPVPSHRASFRGQPVVLEVQWHTPSAAPAAAGGAAGSPQHQQQQAVVPMQHRARMPASSTDYVGVVRQRVGEVVGLPASSLRLLCAGHEWADDAVLLSSVVPRAALAASVSGRAPIITVAPRGGGAMPMDQAPRWPQGWKSTPMGLLSTKPSLYHVLLFLADHPHSREVRQEAVHMLQLLPTCEWIPNGLAEALAAPSAAQACMLLKRLLLLDKEGAALPSSAPAAAPAAAHPPQTSLPADCEQQQQDAHSPGLQPPLPSSSSAFDVGPTPSSQGLPCPAKLLYTLQALHALMFPAAWPLKLVAQQPQPAGVASQEARAGPQPHVSKVRARNIQNVCGCLPLLMEVAQRAVMEHPPSSQHPCPVGSALQPPSSLPAMSLVPGAAQPAQPLEAGTAAGVAAGTAAGGDQLLKGGPGGDVQPIQQQGSDQNNAPVFPSPCWATDGGAGYLTELHSAITHLLYNIVQDVIDHHQQQQQQQEQHQVVTTSGVCEGEGRPGPESMDEILTHHLGTPTGMLRSLSVATPTPGNRHDSPSSGPSIVAAAAAATAAMAASLGGSGGDGDVEALGSGSAAAGAGNGAAAAAGANTSAVASRVGAQESMDIEGGSGGGGSAAGPGAPMAGPEGGGSVPQMQLPPQLARQAVAGTPACHARETMEVEGPSPANATAPTNTATRDRLDESSDVVVLVLDTPTLQSMTELLLRICWDASRLTITLTPPPAAPTPASTGHNSQQCVEGSGPAGGSISSCSAAGGAAALSGACSSSSGGGSGIAWLQDAVVGVVREGMGLLGKLLVHHPPLYSALFSEPRAGQLLAESLLHASNPALRAAAAEQLHQLCLGPHAPASGLLWLLRQLHSLRGVVPVAFASVCGEYYGLFHQVVSLLPELGQKGQPEVELQVYQLAESLLLQEVDALTDVDSCCMPTGSWSSSPRPALTTTPTGATLPALGSSTSDGSVSGHGARQDVLRGRLEVVRALIQALDRAGEGSSTHQELVRLLLRSYLFPQTGVLAQIKEVDRAIPNLVVTAQASQAAQKAAFESGTSPPASVVPPAQIAACSATLNAKMPNHIALRRALDVCACDPAARQAAFNLVAELMSGCSTTMAAGFDTLSKLHFTEGMGPMPKQPAKAGAGGAPLEALRPTHGYVGLRNGGATCYMNSVLQQLFMQPRIRALVLACVPTSPEEAPGSVFAQLQVMFAHLALGRAAYFNPAGFWDSFRDYDGEPINIREHQDAYEFFTRLQDGVDAHMRSVGSPLAMSAVLGGTFAQQVICREGPYRSERDDEFLQISVDVRGKGSLEKSLESYVQGELMEGENAWLCEEVGQRMAATKRTCIKQLPHTLAIHLKRFEYDHINMQRFKVRDRFEFPTTLDMYKYTAEGLAAMEGSSAQALLQNSSNSDGSCGATGPSAAAAAGAALSSGSPPRSTYLYELSGVVVHSGSAFAGHYYSYIRERPCVRERGPAPEVSEGSWFRFDDRCVTPWDPSCLEAECFGGGGSEETERPNSAYMLFYDRKDATCFETDPVQWSVNPVQVVEHQENLWAEEQQGRAEPSQHTGPAPHLIAALQGATAAGTAAAAAGTGSAGAGVLQGGTAAGGKCVGSGGNDLAATPYGMPMRLYRDVLTSNLNLAHRAHTFDKMYAGFVRSVAEQRHDRAAGDARASGRKTRRTTQLHEPVLSALPPSPQQHQQQPLQIGAESEEGTPRASNAVQHQQQQGPSSLRVQDVADAAAQAARLAAAFIGNVLLQAPSALKNSELQAWDDLLASLLTSSHTALCTFVRELLQPGLQNVVMNFLVGAGNLSPVAWLNVQLRRVQAQLVAASNQVLPRDLPEGSNLEPLLTMEPMSAHQQMLAWAWQHICQQYNQVVQARNAYLQIRRNRSQNFPNYVVWNLANPLPCTSQPFFLLADAIALDALLVSRLPALLPIFLNAATFIAECLCAGYRDTHEDDMLDNLSAVVAGLFQGLLRCPQLEVYQPLLLPNGHVKQPTLDIAMGRAWAAQVAEETELQCCTRDDPGPPHLLVLPVDFEFRPLSRLLTAPKGEEHQLIVALMTSGEMLADASNAHMLRLLCWENMATSRQVLTRYIHLLAQTLGEVADTPSDLVTKMSMLSKTVMVAGDLMNLPDSYQHYRLQLGTSSSILRSNTAAGPACLGSLLLSRSQLYNAVGTLAMADALGGAEVADVFNKPQVLAWCQECAAMSCLGERNLPAAPAATFEGRDRTCMDTFVLLMLAWGCPGNLLVTLSQLRNLQQNVLKDSTPRTLRPFRRLTEFVDVIYPICVSGASLAQQQQQLQQEEEPEPVGYVPMDDGMSDGDLDQADQMSAEDGEDEVEEGSGGGGQTGTPPAPL